MKPAEIAAKSRNGRLSQTTFIHSFIHIVWQGV